MSKLGKEIGEVNNDFKEKFLDDLLDDFNVPKSLSIIPDILRSELSDKDKLATIFDFDQVWGLNLNSVLDKEDQSNLSEEIKELILREMKPEKIKILLNLMKLERK